MRMDGNMDGLDPLGQEKLDSLWSEYRSALPEPEMGASFMPSLWQKIEARRTDPIRTLRRFAKVCVMTAAAVALILAISASRIQQNAPITTSYVDALSAEHAADYIEVADVL
jgi:hypothetical protein